MRFRHVNYLVTINHLVVLRNTLEQLNNQQNYRDLIVCTKKKTKNLIFS